MKELIEFIVLSLVEDKDSVSVAESTDEDGSILIEIHVNPEEMGKVIGKNGRIAKAIRTVARSAAVKQDKKVRVEILDD